jgi:hypothetical protein
MIKTFLNVRTKAFLYGLSVYGPRNTQSSKDRLGGGFSVEGGGREETERKVVIKHLNCKLAEMVVVG